MLKRIVGQAPVFNPRYLDFAGHYGFDISACNVGKGNEKRRVELCQTTVLLEKERSQLNRLPLHRYDVATVCQVRASSQFRVTIDTNRYSVQAEYASREQTAKIGPELVCFYHDNRLDCLSMGTATTGTRTLKIRINYIESNVANIAKKGIRGSGKKTSWTSATSYKAS